jgi:hypothetical protein
MRLVDKNGISVEVGLPARIKRVIGRYGQTDIVDGLLCPVFRSSSDRLHIGLSGLFRMIRNLTA